MLSKRISMTDRVVAVLLSITLVLAMIPFRVFAEAVDYEGKYTITVKDDQNMPIKDADVTYQVTVKESDDTSWSDVEVSADTDTNGIVAINLTGYESQLTDGAVLSIGYKITKEGYFDAEGTVKDITSVEGSKDVQLTERKSFLIFYNGSTETVTKPKNLNGIVAVSDDGEGNKQIIATPNAGYRVEEVKTGADMENLTVDDTLTVANGGGYTALWPADESCYYEIAFGLNQYSITAAETENGQVAVVPAVAEHGSDVKVTINPDSGYTVESVQVDTVDVDLATLQVDGETLYFDIENVQEDKTVTVTFKEADPTTLEKVAFSAGEEPVKTDAGNKVYVYKKDSTVTFAPKEPAAVAGIRLYAADDALIGGRYDTAQVEITQSTDIGKIQLYYDHAWHTVGDISNEAPLKIVIDETAPAVTVTPDPMGTNDKGYYTSDIKVTLDGSDEASGVEKIEYWIAKDSVEGSRQTIDAENGEFTLTAADYNTDDVSIYAQAFDCAGNVSEVVEAKVKIYAGTPKFNVLKTETKKAEAVEEYCEKMEIKVTFDDRQSTFNLDAAAKGILVEDGEGNPVDLAAENMLAWNDQEATLTFSEDGVYHFKGVDYTNLAGVTGTDDTELSFIVDNTAPSGTIRISEDEFWEKLLEKLTFGIYKNETIQVSAESPDADVKSILYYKAANPDSALDAAALQNIYETDPSQFVSGPIEVKQNERFVVYARIADKAGNVTYISTEDVVYDDTAPDAPTIQLPQTNDEGYYTEDVQINFSATDNGDAGISYIEYWFEKDGVQEEKKVMTGESGEVTLAAADYNSENVKIYAQAHDRAGNVSNISTVELDIYYGNPKVTVEATGTCEEGAKAEDGYYNKNALIIIEYEDRYTVEKSHVIDGLSIKRDGNSVTLAEESISLENDRAVVTFTEEGVYTIENIGYTNNAGVTGIIEGEIPEGFVIDKSRPVADATPDESGKNSEGYYVDDVKVTLEGIEQGSAGISYIEYWITMPDGTISEPESIQADPKGGQSYSKDIVVDAEKYNSDDVTVYVQAYDLAGNASVVNSVTLDIYYGHPTGTVSVDGTSLEGADAAYYHEDATVTITYKDRCAVKPADVVNGVVIKKDGNTVTLVEDDISLKNNVAVITFEEEGRYTVESVSYTNTAGVKGEFSGAPATFTIDRTAPTAAIALIDEKGNADTKNIWSTLPNEEVPFNVWKADAVTVKVVDETDIVVDKEEMGVAGVKSISYYKSNETKGLSHSVLKQQKFTEIEKIQLTEEETCVIYARIVDRAGNETYIGTNGIIYDKTEPTIKLQRNGKTNSYIYNKNDAYAPIDIVVTDPGSYAGIAKVVYWIDDESEAVNGEGTVLQDFTEKEPMHNLLVKEWKTGENPLKIDTKKNNRSNVVIRVRATDNAGNVTNASIPLDIDTTEPKITVSYGGDKADYGDRYFHKTRTATVKITERSNHFDANAATKGIVVTATDSKGNTVTDSYSISWKTTKGNSPDEDVHTATVRFTKDANYKVKITYTDLAGNKNKTPDFGKSVAPTNFTIDRVAPTGAVTAKAAEGKEQTWNRLVKDVRFAIWSQSKISITGERNDLTSGISLMQYYKAVEPVSDLSKVSWKSFSTSTGLSITQDQQFIIYLKITDKAGHVTYISTDGLIVDGKTPVVEGIKPEVTIKPEQPVNGIYNDDVHVDIKASDIAPGSGLKKVSYEVVDLGKVTQRGTLYSFDRTAPKQSELKQSFAGSITVDSEKNNSNNVRIIVYAEDNAGNSVKKEKSIKVDTTRPTIDVSYSNNNVDKSRYFKASRTATIRITERNFSAEAVKITMTNTDGKVPTVSKWTKKSGTGNLDDTVWTATIKYTEDGDYTFNISYADQAGNGNRTPDYGQSKAPTRFTIDKVKPKVSVSYDNNNAQNQNHYAAVRTATVVITEHNLSPNGADKDRIQIKMTATNDGARVAVPAVSSWRTNGDRHTATIYYGGNARYTFDIGVTDKAGNTYDDFKEQEFYVDKVIPTIEFSGVEENSANAGDVVPVVSFNDINYDPNRIELTLTGAKNGNVALQGGYADVHNGRVFTFANFAKEKEVDDIYTLTATMWDKAGNTISEDITFSVNRFGSVYTMSDGLKDINGEYIQEARDVVITETNANSISEIKVTLFKNGETIELERGRDYVVDTAGGGGSWYRYTYTIFKKNFENDGVYRITIYSKDEAGNISENTFDTKGANVSFGVDKTPPNVVVLNVEDGKAYDYEKYTARMTASDNLVLTSVAVYLDDYEKPVKVWKDKELKDVLQQNEEFTIEILESNSARNLKVVCVDAAGNEKVEEVTNFYVTTNAFIQFISNKPLLFGTIGGVVFLGWFFFFLIGKRRKKDEDEDENEMEK